MEWDRSWKLRLAVLTTLVKGAPQKPGRTALMKFAYLLQTLRNVPLDYHFELYSYGPYDSTVLGDLSQAVTLKALRSETVYYSLGYGYEFSPTEKGCDAFRKLAADQLGQYENDIAWVLQEFGKDSASRLELVTTIIFAERELNSTPHEQIRTELCRRVKQIKPHFSDDTIVKTMNELIDRHLVTLVS